MDTKVDGAFRRVCGALLETIDEDDAKEVISDLRIIGKALGASDTKMDIEAVDEGYGLAYPEEDDDDDERDDEDDDDE